MGKSSGDDETVQSTLVRPVDEIFLIEERRKRREAIKARYRGQATPLLAESSAIDNSPGPPIPKMKVTVEDPKAMSKRPLAVFNKG